MFCTIMVALPALAPKTALAQREKNPKSRLEKLEQEIETRSARKQELENKAETLAAQRSKLQEQIIILAEKIRISESEQNALEAELEKLAISEAAMIEKLQNDRATLAQVLAALQRFEKDIPPALAVRPDDALAGIRGAMAMAAIVPQLKKTADSLKLQLDDLTAIRSNMHTQKDRLETEKQQAAQTRRQMAELVIAKQATEQKTRQSLEVEKRAIARLVRESKSLRELVERLDRRKRQQAVIAGFPKAKGRLPLPVSGKLLNASETAARNQATGREGIYVKSRANAIVTAPYAAHILYAGAFRDYGKILILGVGKNYHILLAGLGTFNVESGQFVLAGEPLAIMQNTSFVELLTLYIEIRYNSEPIEATSWFKRF